MSATECNQWHCLGHGLRAGTIIAVIWAVVMTAILITGLALRNFVREREFAHSHGDPGLGAPSRRQSIVLENAACTPRTAPPTSLQSESRSDLTVTPHRRPSVELNSLPFDHTLFATRTPTESWATLNESGPSDSNLRQTIEENARVHSDEELATELTDSASLRSSSPPVIDQADHQSFSSTISQASSTTMEPNVAEYSHLATPHPEGYNRHSWYIRRKRTTKAEIERWAEEERAAEEARDYPRDQYRSF